ncbi:uncharacterized protein CC84DRAFT_1008919 [Paraphaeosphaeria sporulosa]|uniref:Uncharacterized protein n=1 Tax=Paraphaeosphaeria sporulosa TaxID=1460663 RepID=A0A177C6B7_9PLEO|nr:uncharacterized protein CC84DRAFT_1008919 [Paraphaeosphaeria sporulosa]OAG02318.1 hypothetical protein CC84DRAFT_1008919 [Paraphaeosphaeria sporulosa]
MDAASQNTSFSSLYDSYLDRADTKSQPINVDRPDMRRTASAEHNAIMRQIMEPWGNLSSTPPACRAVSYSSWRHFSATSSNQSKSRDEMTASALLGENGLAPDFNPPMLERCNLSIAEEVVCGNPTAQPPELPQLRQRNRDPRYYPRFQRTQSRRASSTGSWSTLASESSYQMGASEPVSFNKQMVRPASTSSLLTMSFKESPKAPRCTEPPKAALDKIGKDFGIERLSIDNLPEDAFESDSEDGD